jgi:hypothetical protein
MQPGRLQKLGKAAFCLLNDLLLHLIVVIVSPQLVTVHPQTASFP